MPLHAFVSFVAMRFFFEDCVRPAWILVNPDAFGVIDAFLITVSPSPERDVFQTG